MTIMYMLLIISLSICLMLIIATMYMFAQNSKKKIAHTILLLNFYNISVFLMF